jgi:hypothetical protein
MTGGVAHRQFVQGVLPMWDDIVQPSPSPVVDTSSTRSKSGVINPTDITDKPWVLVRAPGRKLRERPPNPDRTGKWMVFQRPAAHDALWERVKAETEAGRLGIGSKAATGKSNSLSLGKHLPIIVYTYDYADQDDVTRVRDALRALGVTWPISYKADRATRDGQYSSRGDRVSMYRV